MSGSAASSQSVAGARGPETVSVPSATETAPVATPTSSAPAPVFTILASPPSAPKRTERPALTSISVSALATTDCAPTSRSTPPPASA